jgi:hypothetical protein
MYRHARERARQQLVDEGHVAAAISKARTNRDLARFPGPIRQCVSYLKNSLSIASREATRTETFPKTAIDCHLLPFSRRKTATPVVTVSSLTCPSRPCRPACHQSLVIGPRSLFVREAVVLSPWSSVLGLHSLRIAGHPGPRAENRERGREEPRCKAAIEGQFVP